MGFKVFTNIKAKLRAIMSEFKETVSDISSSNNVESESSKAYLQMQKILLGNQKQDIVAENGDDTLKEKIN